jgi:hypothetical protein
MAVKYPFTQDIDTVWAALCDPDFRVARCEALGETEVECEIEEDGDKVHITVNRGIVRELPSFLAKLFNPKQYVMLVEHWQKSGRGWEGTVAIEIKGQPVKLSGVCSLIATANGCEYTIDHSCKAKIPLVGGKVEKFVLSQTDTSATEELDYLKSHLA